MSEDKTKCKLTIQSLHIESNSPETMKAAFGLVGALLGALASPVFGEPPITAKPKQIKKRAAKTVE
jgi:hypothetical protein